MAYARAALTSPGTESSRAQRFGLAPAFSNQVSVLLLSPRQSNQSINLPVSTTRPQSSIALLAKLSWDLRSPHRRQLQPNETRRRPRRAVSDATAWLAFGQLLEAAQNIANCDCQELGVLRAIPRLIRERSSLISRSKDAAAVALQEHSFALLPIAGRAFLQPRHHKHVASGPNAATPMLAAQPCPSHKAAPCPEPTVQCSRVDGLMLVNTTRYVFRTPSWVRATLPAFTGPVGLHPYRQGAKPSQHSAACSILATVRGPGPGRPRANREPFPSTIVSIAAPRSTTLPTSKRFRGPIS